MSRHTESFESATGSGRLSAAERRQRLAVLCALDRAQLRLVFATPPRSASSSENTTADGLKTVLGATRFLPGKLGVWSRRIGMVASLLRLLR